VTQVAPSHCSDVMPIAVIPGRGDVQYSIYWPKHCVIIACSIITVETAWRTSSE